LPDLLSTLPSLRFSCRRNWLGLVPKCVLKAREKIAALEKPQLKAISKILSPGLFTYHSRNPG
jgi:hypothetical protein